MAADVDDQATALGPKARELGIAKLKNTGEVQLQQPVPLLQTGASLWCGEGSASIVDQH